MGKHLSLFMGIALSFVILHATSTLAADTVVLRTSDTAEPATTAKKKKKTKTNPLASLAGLGQSASGSAGANGGAKSDATVVTGDCGTTPDPTLISQYDSCKTSVGSAATSKNSFLVDTDNKVAFVLSPTGTILKCVPITVGAASTGNPATLGASKNETRQGMFLSQRHNGERYQTDASDPAKDGIGIGDSSGRIIHSSHGNRTTAGCIGIVGNPNTAAGADAAFLEIKKLLGTDGAPVFVHGKNYGGCGDNFGRRSESTESERSRRGNTTRELDGID